MTKRQRLPLPTAVPKSWTTTAETLLDAELEVVGSPTIPGTPEELRGRLSHKENEAPRGKEEAEAPREAEQEANEVARARGKEEPEAPREAEQEASPTPVATPEELRGRLSHKENEAPRSKEEAVAPREAETEASATPVGTPEQLRIRLRRELNEVARARGKEEAEAPRDAEQEAAALDMRSALGQQFTREMKQDAKLSKAWGQCANKAARMEVKLDWVKGARRRPRM